MNRTELLLILAVVCCSQGQTASQPSYYSVYTSLSGDSCKLLKVKEEGANSVQQCPGVGGFQLVVLDSDARQSITVISPDGRKFPLSFWDIITRDFSTLGNRAEWRVIRSAGRTQPRPAAVIVRVTASEQGASTRTTSYLTVTKLAGSEICLVAKINPSPSANEDARKVADRATTMPCLKLTE